MSSQTPQGNADYNKIDALERKMADQEGRKVNKLEEEKVNDGPPG